MVKLLITGFEPFGSENVNPSYEAVKRLSDKIGDYEIEKYELPVVFHDSWTELRAVIEHVKPKVVILVGQADGRSSIAIERIAKNIDDSRFPDNNHNQPKQEPIVEGGHDGYFTTLPYNEIVNNILQGGVPAYVSDDAGTFVCNHIMYQLLHYNKKKNLGLVGGFIHVPFSTDQVLVRPTTASLTLEQITKALELAIQAL